MLSSRFSDTLRSLENVVSQPGMSGEERRRRGFLALCILVMIPTLAVYGFGDLIHGRAAEAWATFAMAAVMIFVLATLPRLRDISGALRITVLLAVGLVLYLTATGGGDGLVFIWFYTLPLIAFFLFGNREGAVWILATLAILVALFFGELGSHLYDSAVGVRFLITYGIVSVLGFGLEASRRRRYDQLMAEKTSLEEAIAQVKTLSGLLPICSACKSVRDDHGYWSQIETYVRRHSETEFTRGLCPECSQSLLNSASTSSPGAHAPHRP